jgi:hypothetical protein
VLHVEWVNGTIPVGVGDEPTLAFALHGVRPCPARGPLQVDFTLPRAGHTAVELLDVAGRRIASRQLGVMAAGRHQVELRERLAAGLYLVRVAHEGAMRSAKAVVVR